MEPISHPRGSTTRNRQPRSVLATLTCPPWASMIPRVMASPRPAPPLRAPEGRAGVAAEAEVEHAGQHVGCDAAALVVDVDRRLAPSRCRPGRRRSRRRWCGERRSRRDWSTARSRIAWSPRTIAPDVRRCPVKTTSRAVGERRQRGHDVVDDVVDATRSLSGPSEPAWIRDRSNRSSTMPSSRATAAPICL